VSPELTPEQPGPHDPPAGDRPGGVELQSPRSRRSHRYWPLWARIVFFSVLLVLLLQAAGFGLIRSTIDTNARRALAANLAVGERVWQQLLEQRSDRLRQAARVLASDFGFRAALASGDRATLVSALENHGGRIEAELAAVFDTGFQPQGAMMPPGSGSLDTLQAMLPELSKGGWGTKVVQGRPFQVVVVPIKAPQTIGWVAMGFPLDAAMLDQLHAITGLQAALLAQSPPEAPRVLHATLGPAADPALLAGATTAELRGPQDTWLLQRVAVGEGQGRRVTLALAGSLEQALAPFRSLQLWLLAITAGAVALFALFSVGMARFITRPLAALMAAADSLRAGRYDTPLAATGRDDEFGELGAAFERMRQGIRGEIYFDQRLTQLPNRLYFRRELDKAFAEARPVTVLVIGLNRFKEINRRIGYAAGDQLLKAMAERLQQVVRPGDFVARLAGDLFAVMLQGADPDDARRAAQRIGHELEQPLDLAGHRVDRSAALGVAIAPLHADGAEALLARAEVALYAAKDRREAFLLYDPAFDRESQANLALLSELRHALANDELRLHLQPKVCLKTGRLSGAEALLRWEHPQRKLVPPGAFIPYAEDSPIIKDLTLWVFEAVVKEQRALREAGIPGISINLSARDLMDLDLPEKLQRLLQRHGAEVAGLCLETTESAVMGDIDRARQTLQRLRDRGFKLSIDDFGEGQTSMRYLKDLPVHELKIDMVFVKGLQTDVRNESIVRALAEVGHEYGLSVVAEGVETGALATRLAELGCDEGQGWHFGKPMPAAALRDWALAREKAAAEAAAAH
jgi:diguanylate cyclase (GGDEF)-like protein